MALHSPPGAASACPAGRTARAAKSRKAPRHVLPIVPKEIFQALCHAAGAGRAGGHGSDRAVLAALGASLREWHIAKFVDDEELDGGELGLEFEQTLFVTRLHQLMDKPNRCRTGAGGEAECQACTRPARAGIAQSDDILAGDNLCAAREFENERLVERRDGGEVESVETFHDWKAGGPDAALNRAPFRIDEFEFGEAQETETLAGGFGGDFFIFAQEGRQFELPQMMRTEPCA
jgi:hypothetical protein